MKVQLDKFNNISLKAVVVAALFGGFFVVASANSDVSTKSVASKKTLQDGPSQEFRGTISGDLLDISPKEGEVVTAEVKHFKTTGENPYRNDSEAIKKGYTIFSTACSGCHGHLAEGKLGPALADEYWTYPKNETDKGLFETIYGGAAGMMGPQRGLLTVDEILHVIAWVRHQGEENAKGGQVSH